jgi:peptidyl-prolyl cis-trans isomerase D
MWMYATNPNRFFSDAARISDGAVILVTPGSIPSRMPAFAEVREEVKAQYRESEKRRLFAEKGKELRNRFEEARSRSDFAEMAAAAGLEVEDVEAFSGAAVPQELRRSGVWEQAQHLAEGRISNMVMGEERGTFAYMAAREVPEIDTDAEEFVSYAQRRKSALGDTLGWVRLREMTDRSLGTVLGDTVEMP